MESIEGSLGRSVNYGGEDGEAGAAYPLYGHEIHSLVAVRTPPPPETGSSFTALLELPANQAMELLVNSPEPEEECQAKLSGSQSGNLPYSHCPPPPPPAPIFPSDAALIDRASKFSVFATATENSQERTTFPSIGSPLVKQEPVGSDLSPHSSPATSNPTVNQKSVKRKECEKKVKESTKKSKKAANAATEDAGEKLPYVHVRARRGQATDSHSLAERARREKINARMKLLQELVPGCNKITGTAMVLDEIINHVQSLQRQVEYLSMRLAAVNPRINFNLDALVAAESGSPGGPNFQGSMLPSLWPEGQIDGNRQQYQHLWHLDGFHQQAWGKEEDNCSFITPENSLISYDSSANSVSLHSNHIKMEL